MKKKILDLIRKNILNWILALIIFAGMIVAYYVGYDSGKKAINNTFQNLHDIETLDGINFK